VATSVEKLLEGFVRVDMPPDVIASIGMSIVGSIIASSPEDSPFRSSSILSLEQLAFKMRHLKDEDIDKTDPNGVFI
jgi:hypothetical protein